MATNVILFGASRLGQAAYIILKDRNNIVAFCDNDKNKWGQKTYDLNIISPEKLKQIPNLKVIITSTYYKEISEQLQDIGISNYEIFLTTLEPNFVDNLNIKEINLGKFLLDLNRSITIDDLTYTTGGSHLLDYVFLKALVIKFNLSTYLEIGTFMGESIANVSDLVEKCYSISLPDEELEYYFKTINKSNFSRYFSKRKNNVIHYYQDSKTFDFKKIEENIDLVFIDGDHSYEGILADTMNVFRNLDMDNTIVVWHDFKEKNRKNYRMTTINAIYNGVCEKFRKNIFAVDNNMCGIYLPDKFINEISFLNDDENIIYSFKNSISIKENVYQKKDD